jgi:internalin A
MTHILNPTDTGVDMVVTSEWSEAETARVRDGLADGVVLNYAYGFRGPDLSFLRGLPLRRVDVLARWIDDVRVVESLGPTLERLEIQPGPKARLDLGALPLLSGLYAPWAMVRDTIGQADRLVDVGFLAYAAPDLAPLAHLRGLEAVSLVHHPRLRCLDGAQALGALERLGVFSASMLQDISAVGSASPALVDLGLGGCRKIPGIIPVGACRGLVSLQISDVGPIESLAPLRDLLKLERLVAYGDTKILDGDLSYLLALPALRLLAMASRKSYAPSVEEVAEVIHSRTGDTPPASRNPLDLIPDTPLGRLQKEMVMRVAQAGGGSAPASNR